MTSFLGLDSSPGSNGIYSKEPGDLGDSENNTVQFSSVAQSCSTLCDPMNCSTPGLPVHHQLPEFRRNGVAIMVNRRVQNAVLGCNLKNDRTISVRFQGKPFNITEIQVYAPTSNIEETEVERFYEDLQDLFRANTQKRCPFHYRGLECKSRKSRNTWSNRQIWPWNAE